MFDKCDMEHAVAQVKTILWTFSKQGYSSEAGCTYNETNEALQSELSRIKVSNEFACTTQLLLCPMRLRYTEVWLNQLDDRAHTNKVDSRRNGH